MRAYVTRSPVDASHAFQPCALNKTDVFPLPYPNIAIALPTKVPAEVITKLKTFGYQEIVYQKEKIITFANPTADQVGYIMSLEHNGSCPSPQFHINTSCLSVLMTIRKIFSNFLLAHTYPAFETDDHANAVENMKLDVRDLKRKGKEPSAGGKKRPRTEQETQDTGDENMSDDGESEDDAESRESIKWAYPPAPFANGWGPLSALPAGDGVFSPFIPELASFDPKGVVSVITRYFLTCLGTDFQTVKAAQELIRSRFAIISKTPVGNVLSHMARCLDIGIQGQCRVFPIFDGGLYEGCAIVGARVKYILNKATVVPVPHDDLVERIRAYGGHKFALEAIFKLCGGKPEHLNEWVDGISSMSHLRKGLMKCLLNESGRDEVLRLASQLRFGPSSPINPDTLHAALGYIVDENKDLPNTFPIHHSMLFEKDRVAVVWSTFGENAPSPAFTGKKWSLDKADHPNHIGFRTGVALREAIADLKQVLASKQLAVPPLQRRSGVHTARVYTGNESRMLWADLVKAAGISVASIAGSNVASGSVGENNLFNDF